MLFMSCFCYVFVCVCSLMPCGHLLGKGWPLGFCLWCLIVKLSLSIGILEKVWCLIVSIPDLCPLSYFSYLLTLSYIYLQNAWTIYNYATTRLANGASMSMNLDLYCNCYASIKSLWYKDRYREYEVRVFLISSLPGKASRTLVDIARLAFSSLANLISNDANLVFYLSA